MRREDGFVAQARRLGAEVASFCQAPPLHIEAVQALVDRLLAARPHPTAIFAAADSVATLVYRALAVREVRVGRDISVISGNNDTSLIAGLHPSLTTFDIHAHEIGRLAVFSGLKFDVKPGHNETHLSLKKEPTSAASHEHAHLDTTNVYPPHRLDLGRGHRSGLGPRLAPGSRRQ